MAAQGTHQAHPHHKVIAEDQQLDILAAAAVGQVLPVVAEALQQAVAVLVRLLLFPVFQHSTLAVAEQVATEHHRQAALVEQVVVVLVLMGLAQQLLQLLARLIQEVVVAGLEEIKAHQVQAATVS